MSTIHEAKEIFGENGVFGPDEWVKFFGNKFQAKNIPEIPWNVTVLKNPGINQEHFLFLGLDRFGSKPLDLPFWHKLYSGEKQPKFHSNWIDLGLKHFPAGHFATRTCGFHWYLMPIGFLGGSKSLPYDRQIALLPNEYEVPIASERVTANILYYLLNQKYLDITYPDKDRILQFNWVRTCDVLDGYRIGVVGDGYDGIWIFYWGDDAFNHIGISASRKLPSN